MVGDYYNIIRQNRDKQYLYDLGLTTAIKKTCDVYEAHEQARNTIA